MKIIYCIIAMLASIMPGRSYGNDESSRAFMHFMKKQDKPDKNTPLHYAAAKNKELFFNRLKQQRFLYYESDNMINNQGLNPFHVLAQHYKGTLAQQDIEILNHEHEYHGALRWCGLLKDKTYNQQQTPADIAREQGNTELAKQLERNKT